MIGGGDLPDGTTSWSELVLYSSVDTSCSKMGTSEVFPLKPGGIARGGGRWGTVVCLSSGVMNGNPGGFYTNFVTTGSVEPE